MRGWQFLGSGRQALVADDGEIIGEVSWALGGGYYASRNLLDTKKFIDEESAKRYVETIPTVLRAPDQEQQ